MIDKVNVRQHLLSHQKYPATYDELVKECEDLKDFSAEDKEWFKANLPKKTFHSAEEVMKALDEKMKMAGMSGFAGN